MICYLKGLIYVGSLHGNWSSIGSYPLPNVRYIQVQPQSAGDPTIPCFELAQNMDRVSVLCRVRRRPNRSVLRARSKYGPGLSFASSLSAAQQFRVSSVLEIWTGSQFCVESVGSPKIPCFERARNMDRQLCVSTASVCRRVGVSSARETRTAS